MYFSWSASLNNVEAIRIMNREEMKEFNSAQVDAMNLAKYYEGIRIGRDPGEEFLRQWVTNGSAAAFRKYWELNKNKKEEL